MATRKTRKFTEGGMSEEDVASFAGTSDNDSNAGMADTTTASDAAPAKAKSKVVTKEELAKSGLSLRDYMNKQQGLTRRGGSTADAAPAKTSTSTSTPAAKKSNILEDAKESVRRGNAARASMAEASRPKVAAGSLPKRGAGLSALSGMKKGGSVKGWGQARGARKAKMY